MRQTDIVTTDTAIAELVPCAGLQGPCQAVGSAYSMMNDALAVGKQIRLELPENTGHHKNGRASPGTTKPRARVERILPIEDYRHSADPSQVHPGADHTCQDIKTTGSSLTTTCVLLICAASRQQHTPAA